MSVLCSQKVLTETYRSKVSLLSLEAALESMGTLVDGLEKMMRSRSDTTKDRDNNNLTDTRPVLKEVVMVRPCAVVLVKL